MLTLESVLQPALEIGSEVDDTATARKLQAHRNNRNVKGDVGFNVGRWRGRLPSGMEGSRLHRPSSRGESETENYGFADA